MRPDVLFVAIRLYLITVYIINQNSLAIVYKLHRYCIMYEEGIIKKKDRPMEKNIINKFLGYDERPKMSSWAREQMQKQNTAVPNNSYRVKFDIPTKKEMIRKEKRKKKLYTMVIIILVLLTLLYETKTGNKVEDKIEELTSSYAIETTNP